jgi:hypothetical protein
MKKALPIILSLALSGALGLAANKGVKKDDAPAEGKTMHKGGSPADKNIKKDDAPAPDAGGKTQQKAKAPAKSAN